MNDYACNRAIKRDIDQDNQGDDTKGKQSFDVVFHIILTATMIPVALTQYRTRFQSP
jgi:hypothetical protein